MKPWTLGLTGGIGSGKSAAAQCFIDLGVAVIDADQAARWVVEPGRPALQAIAAHFGPDVLNTHGGLDRAHLRSLIFANTQEREWLEALLHPLIREEIVQFLENSQGPYNILVSPLLIESGQHQLTQRVLVIDAAESLQVQRTVNRDGVSEAQVNAIMTIQLPREERLRHADDIVKNDQDYAFLAQQIQTLHHFYLTLHGGRP